MKTAKISVIIPIYNTAQYLRQCLDSVIHQSLKDIEIICVDDGSTDNSLQILQEYAKKDKRIIILQQENQGAGVARNYGMKVATAEYLSFLDSDDFFEPQFLYRLLQAIEENNSDIAVCHSDQYYTSSNRYLYDIFAVQDKLLPKQQPFSSRDIEHKFFSIFIWWAWDKLFKKSLVQSLHLDFMPLKTTNDLFFVAAYTLKSDKISVIPDILVHHRKDNANSLEATRDKSYDNFYTALLALRDFMIKENMFNHFEQDFVNYALSFSLWHLETLSSDTQFMLLNSLQQYMLKNLGCLDKSEDYFYDNLHYKKMIYYMNYK